MIFELTRYVYRLLMPPRMREAMDIFRYLRAERVEGLTESRVLILAPHPDDDIVACGGTVQLYYQRGAQVACAYMTDGRKGGPACDEDELAERRREEAQEGAAIIGIDEPIFLDNRDGELAVNAETVTQLMDILRKIKPEAVFLPFLTDNHHDHRATSRIFLSAIKAERWGGRCYCWGIWTPLPYFNISADITPCIDAKKRALKAHRSQTAYFDLVGGALSFSRYNYILAGGKERKGWTEVFLACPAAEFVRLAEAIEW